MDRAVGRLARERARGALLDSFFARAYEEHFRANPDTLLVNFGPGRFRHEHWLNADKHFEGQTWGEARGRGYLNAIDLAWDMMNEDPIALEDQSVSVAYSSHVLEHAWDADGERFLREVLRCLVPEGTLRLVVPDADVYYRAYRASDVLFAVRYQFASRWEVSVEHLVDDYRSEARTLEHFVLEHFSLLTYEANDPCLSPADAREFFRKHDGFFRTLAAASEQSNRELNRRIGRHVNWYNREKLCRRLVEAGFRAVEHSAYGQSNRPILRDTRYFDITDPDMSLYIEATK